MRDANESHEKRTSLGVQQRGAIHWEMRTRTDFPVQKKLSEVFLAIK